MLYKISQIFLALGVPNGFKKIGEMKGWFPWYINSYEYHNGEFSCHIHGQQNARDVIQYNLKNQNNNIKANMYMGPLQITQL